MAACTTCVRRGLDCDAARPRCFPCKRSHLKCAYNAPAAVFEFRDETDNVRASSSTRPKRQRISGGVTATSVTASHTEQPPNTLGDGLLLCRDDYISQFDLNIMPWVDDVIEGYMDPFSMTTASTDFAPNQLSSLDQMSSVPVLSPQPGHSLSPTDLRAGLLASEGSIPASPSAASTISDHVLAQHYTRSLTGRYSSKDPGWNYYMHFYTRFSTTHTFVLSSLYAWTSVHLYCTGNLSSRANALTHYQKAISEIRNAYGLELLAEDIQYQAQMVVSGVGKEDLDAIAVAMYFLASTDLMLSRAINLRWILQFEAGLIRARMPTSFETLFSQIATWFCFLDSRASAFGATESQVIVAIGGEAGLLEAMDRSRYLLQREYNLLYPPKEQQRDRAHTPLLKLTNRLVAIFGLISLVYVKESNAEKQSIRMSLDECENGLRCMNEDTASNGKVLSTYLTTMMLFHCLEIYYSRTFEPGAPLYSADDHASNLITTVNKYYQLLKYPQTEPPPTKFWPIPLVMAAIEARDPIYRDWARRRIQDYKNAGEHYARSVEFADKVQRSEEKSGRRANLNKIAESLGDEFLL